MRISLEESRKIGRKISKLHNFDEEEEIIELEVADCVEIIEEESESEPEETKKTQVSKAKRRRKPAPRRFTPDMGKTETIFDD